MKKIPSLFKRDYEGTRLVYDEIVEGCEWVLLGEGVATLKWDGTCCMIQHHKIHKRYDAKVMKSARKRVKREGGLYHPHEFKPPADDWIPAQDEPDYVTGHFPGWLPIDPNKPEDQYHFEALKHRLEIVGLPFFADGTYELIGEKIQGNPYNNGHHTFWLHGSVTVDAPRTFEALRDYLAELNEEGIVFHHPDGRMCKVKRKDFGLDWPLIASEAT